MDRQAQQQARLRFLAESLAPEQKLDFGALAAHSQTTRQVAPASPTEPATTTERAPADPTVASLPAHEIRPALEAALRSSRSAPTSAAGPVVAHSAARLPNHQPAAKRSGLPSRLALASLGVLLTAGAIGGPTLVDYLQGWSGAPKGASETHAATIAATTVPTPPLPVAIETALAAPIAEPAATVSPMPAPAAPERQAEITIDPPPALAQPIEILAVAPTVEPSETDARPTVDRLDPSLRTATVAATPEAATGLVDIVVPIADMPSLVIVADVSAILPTRNATPEPSGSPAASPLEAAMSPAPRPAPEAPRPAVVESRPTANFTEPSTTALVARAQAILAHGDIFGARLLLKRAADLGDADAKAALAKLPASARGLQPAPNGPRP